MQSKNRSERASKGFTLIELLVVVAIIAVLISILLPALGLAKKQAKQLLCNTNLRSMGQAMMLYADENNGGIIRSELDVGGVRATGDNIHFAQSLLKYLEWDGRISGLYRNRRSFNLITALRQTPTFQCPSFPVVDQQLDYVVSAFVLPYTLRNIRADFGARRGHGSSFSQTQGQNNFDYAKFSKLSDFSRHSPSRFIIYTEAHSSLLTNNLGFHDTWATSQLPWGAFPRMSDDKRHPGGINAAFFDGSARTMGFTVIDVGWPEKQQFRLKWFTVVPPEIEP